ncbi:uncharacterized protein E5676_scaffold124G001090 [Cucumis melo var. makuwa]|uniref:Uncharacterized protein n=1 Tax=Cucumis melo var. makuwa TaxID=1194695 RepID=A0A5D3DSV4_CUCMM|nr:uncharacterized protein E5676_scaffold124G001090 [Cucumis melo var. makuwa]
MDNEEVIPRDIMGMVGVNFNPPARNNNGKALTTIMKTHNNNPFGQINVIGVDPNWYVDSRAKNHVTPEFNNLINPIEYGGKELVMVRNDIAKNLVKDMGCTILKGTFRDGLYHLEDTAAVKDLVQHNSHVSLYIFLSLDIEIPQRKVHRDDYYFTISIPTYLHSIPVALVINLNVDYSMHSTILLPNRPLNA